MGPGATLRATLFGAFALATSDDIEITISSRRARALLAMLCLTPREALERDYVSKLLWPGRFQAQRRASLRQCLSNLDKLLTPLVGGVLDLSRGRIALVTGRIRSDLWDLEEALSAGDTALACSVLASIGNRKILEQMDFGSAFQEWLTAQRRHVENRLQIGVDRALDALGREGDSAAQTRLSEGWRSCARASLVEPQRKVRIAVLPFAQHDEIGDAPFLAEGIVEELTFRLSAIPALAVVGRTSVTSVAGSGRTLPEMASALNVSYLVEGNVHRFAEGIRVSLRLIDGHSGTEIWSDRYDGTISEVVASRRGKRTCRSCRSRTLRHTATTRSM